MATTITVREVFYRVSTLLLDIVPAQFVRWTEVELVTWLNDGQRAIAKYAPFACHRIDAVKLRPGTKQSIAQILAADIKPGDGSTPATKNGIALVDVIRNMGADGLTPGLPINVVQREEIDSISPNWHSVAGNGVIDHFVFNPLFPKDFYVVPAADAATWVEVAFNAAPAAIPLASPAGKYAWVGSSDATVISLDDIYIDDIVNYIAARAFMKDAAYAANQSMAQFYAGLFTASLNAHVEAITGTNPNLNFLPFSPMPLGTAR